MVSDWIRANELASWSSSHVELGCILPNLPSLWCGALLVVNIETAHRHCSFRLALPPMPEMKGAVLVGVPRGQV